MEETAPVEPSGDFRQAMRAFATGVAIIACGEGETRAGCVATAVASLSLAPPSLIVNLQRDRSTYLRLRDCAVFSVNLLTAEQEALALRFAGEAQRLSRFDDGGWAAGATGAPTLLDALAVLECRIEEILERHTHAIIIGRVESSRAREESALLHFRGRFERI